MASYTKLMTLIVALQYIKRGQIGFEDNVLTVLIELKGIKILIGKGCTKEPTFKKAENKITLW